MASVGVWLVLALVGALAAGVWRWLALHRAKFGPCERLIPGPPGLPLIGNALLFCTHPSEYIRTVEKLRAEYGKIIRIKMATTLAVLTMDHQDAEVILKSYKDTKKGFVYRFAQSWVGEGLVTSDGEKWHQHRKIITPAFHFKILENNLEAFKKNTKRMVLNLMNASKKGYLDITYYVNLCTLDTISETAMGEEINAQDNGVDPKYIEAVKIARESFITRTLQPWYYPDIIFNLSPYGRKVNKCINLLHNKTNEIIRRRKHYLETHKENNINDENHSERKQSFFLNTLLTTARHLLSDRDIREEVDTFMVAGHDTTTSAICFGLYELAKHPDIQEKIFQELKDFTKDGDLLLTMQTLQEMTYLDKVVKETLRLYAVIPIIARDITKDIYLPHRNISIPAGAIVAIVPFFIHRDPEIYPNPEKFNPENFSQEAMQKRHTYAYIPFSAGPRNCIGQKFALLQMKTTLAMLIWNFHLKLDPDYKLEMTPLVSLKWMKGIPISFQRRNL